MSSDPLEQRPYDPKLSREATEYEDCEVSGVAVKLILMPDPEHLYGGNYTYGWKATMGKNQYGDFLGHLDTKEQARRGRDVLLEQCALSIEAIRKKEVANGLNESEK